MEFVTEWIAIGDRRDARNIRRLKEEGIEAVLCVANWVRVPRKKYAEERILCFKLPLWDSRPVPASQRESFFAALGFLDEMVRQRKRCLIHCAAGVSRSSAFLAAWMHTRLGVSWEEAVVRIQTARPIIQPHPKLLISMASFLDAEVR